VHATNVVSPWHGGNRIGQNGKYGEMATGSGAADAAEEDEFASNIIEQVFDLWVIPELARRGEEPDRSLVNKALVIMIKDRAPEVLLNSEFVLATKARTTRDIEAGEAITAADIADIESMHPEDIDPNAAWIAYLALPDGKAFVSFTFLYERGKARSLLAIANSYLATARRALEAGDVRPAIENANAASELAVMAQMRVHLEDEDPKDKHKSRCRWFDSWAALGNADDAHAKAVRRLAQLRPFVRYADESMPPKEGEVAKLVETVEQIVARATALAQDAIADEEGTERGASGPVEPSKDAEPQQ
jgi:hypothetical protein